MSILIVERNPHLGQLWQRHLNRQGRPALLAHDQDEAIAALQTHDISLIVLDIDLGEGSALAIADYAAYRFPALRIVFVTSTTFFSDGSIFNHAVNACAYLGTDTPPEDLAAMVDYYAAAN